jgi:hypothetical protein
MFNLCIAGKNVYDQGVFSGDERGENHSEQGLGCREGDLQVPSQVSKLFPGVHI